MAASHEVDTQPSDLVVAQREHEVHRYALLDASYVGELDELAELASVICQTPIAAVSILDQAHQYFVAAKGADHGPSPIGESFCAHAVSNKEDVFVVPDAAQDPRFRENAFVTGALALPQGKLRAYAGTPLVTPSGVGIGALCVIDHEARNFTDEQRRALLVLGKQVVARMELRRKLAESNLAHKRLQVVNKQLDQFAYIISHDLKAPIRHQIAFAEIFLEDFADKLPTEAAIYIDHIRDAGTKTIDLITDISEYLHTVQDAGSEKTTINLEEAVTSALRILEPPATVQFEYELSDNLSSITANPTALRHVLVNLISNAFKFTEGHGSQVKLSFSKRDGRVLMQVTDDGVGMTESDAQRAFQLFTRGGNSAATAGKGVGLAIVERLVSNMGGVIELDSELGRGTTVTIALPT